MRSIVASFVCVCALVSCLYIHTTHALLTKPLSSLSLNSNKKLASSSALSAQGSSSAHTHTKFGFGINGFGRIGRLVTRIMVNEPKADLKAINTGAEANYMAYQVIVFA
jgi:hypothetical protein